MDSDWNVRRKARGRIRQARLRRRRQRITAVGLFLLLCLGIFAFGAVDYGKQRHIDLEIAKHPRVSFSLPKISPMIAQAGTSGVDDLPDLLPIKERFPDYGDVPQPLNPDDGSNADQDDQLEESSESRMVILDDLRAAPPKSMFIDAVFDTADTQQEIERVVFQFSHDFTDPYPNLFGHPPVAFNPPIPEPGTGVLLTLGLIAIASRRRHERKRLANSPTIRSNATARSTDGHET